MTYDTDTNGSAADNAPFAHDLPASVPFATVLLSRCGQILAANALFAEWNEKAAGSILEIVADRSRALLSAALADLAEGKPVSPLELHFQGSGANPRPGLAGLTHDPESGRTLLQIAPLDPIGTRESAIAALEERWRHALVASQLAVWDHDLKNDRFEFSDMWLQIRGLTSPDDPSLGSPAWIDHVHPDDREHTLRSIERQNLGDPDYAAFRYRIRHREGHWIWIECRGMCIERDENGKPSRSAGTDADVTSRKDWEDSMTAMSQRLRLALDISRIGVFEANLVTHELSWDDRMFEIYGLDSDPPINLDVARATLIHPEDQTRVREKSEEHVARLQAYSDEYRIIRGDGSIAHVRMRAQPFIDSLTGHVKLVGANWDVSEDIALQKQLREARDLAEAHNLELEEAHARIEHNALHDHLTGLPNRRYFDRILDQAVKDEDLAILHIDLDRFKQINDTQGHSVGDAMLKHVAGVLGCAVRSSDFIARIGGDEFVAVVRVPGPQSHLAALASRIIDELRKPVDIGGHACRIGASIGIARSTHNVRDARQLLQNADIALYRAKNLGRNRFEIFSSGMQQEIINTKKMSDQILLALERSEFVPYYQFQFDARTLDITGAETLARWQHPTQGILTPDRFLSIADDLDAVSTIDSQILDKGLADFRRWQAAGLGIPKISVNVSARRLHDPALSPSIRQLGMEPGTVSFELLESIFLDDYDAVVADNLQDLKSLGIDIEIDDFGSGHASIVSLIRLAPATLKIDRQLIMPLPGSPEQQKLVGSIIEIGHSLNIRVVAEGVETPAHIRILRDLGCDALQGYGLARPMPASGVPAFLEAAAWRTADRG